MTLLLDYEKKSRRTNSHEKKRAKVCCDEVDLVMIERDDGWSTKTDFSYIGTLQPC